MYKAIACAFGVMLILMAAFIAGGRFFGTTSSVVPTPVREYVGVQVTPHVTVAPSNQKVVVRILEPDISALQKQGVLLTAAYIVTSTVTTEREPVAFVWNGEHIDLSAQSVVYAGVDMGKMTYDQSTRTITLPASGLGPVDMATPDITQTLSLLYPSSNNGEMTELAITEARAQMVAKACRANVTGLAATEAIRRIKATLSSVGLDDVNVEGSVGECQ